MISSLIFLPRSEERIVLTDVFSKINDFDGFTFYQLVVFNF